MKKDKVTYKNKFRYLKRDWKLDKKQKDAFIFYQEDGDITTTSASFLYKYFDYEIKEYKDGKTYYVVSHKR